MEGKYEFRNRLKAVHEPGLRDDNASWAKLGCVVDESWEIVRPVECARVMTLAAEDLQEFFRISMGLTLAVRAEPEPAVRPKAIVLAIGDAGSPEQGAYAIESGEGIVITGASPKGCAQGCYALEEQMKFNRGPGIENGRIARRPLFSPRMVHSGYGLDMYPDAYLRLLAGAGFDTLLVFIRDFDAAGCGDQDWGDLIRRADDYGLKVYAYSYIKLWKHPDEPDARACYEAAYGRLFERYPGFAGVVLVGESVEFPSTDPRAVCLRYTDVTPENNPENKPTPGWYPCFDYPKFVGLIRDVVRERNPDADIVFWTYNWGYVEEKARLDLIRSLPKDISLQATFEMFEPLPAPNGVEERCVDYTLSYPGPGKYFASEARTAAERGIRLYTMCNTGGLTWDFGVIPYEPAPEQWKKRHAALLKAREEYGLSGLMESHHFGFWPSMIAELAKNAYWEPSVPPEEMLKKLAERDYGEACAPWVLEALHQYSQAVRQYVPTEEDQYGPYRIGPAYPLLFLKKETLPEDPGAWFGNDICFPMYQYDLLRQSKKMDYEIAQAEAVRAHCRAGNEMLEKAMLKAQGRFQEAVRRLLALGRFMENSALTVEHVKRWHILKWRLLERIPQSGACPQSGGADEHILQEAAQGPILSPEEKCAVLGEMCALAEAEIQNAQNTIPLVTYDSRLGWEPSMGYMCDAEHLEWKIRATKRAVEQARVFARTRD